MTTKEKMERRIGMLEKSLSEMLQLADSVVLGAATNLACVRARTLLGIEAKPDTSDPCPICKKPFKTCGHF